MKLPHVIVFSLIGMTVASLSVLVFTSPRQAPQDDLTSNETETTSVPSASSAPTLRLELEPDPTASSRAPRPKSRSQASLENRVGFGSLNLTAVDEPCSFFIDGKPVKVQNDVPLMVRVGTHKVRCERPNGDAIEKRVEVVEEAINPVFF